MDLDELAYAIWENEGGALGQSLPAKEHPEAKFLGHEVGEPLQSFGLVP